MASVRDHYEYLLGQHYHHLAPSLDGAMLQLEELGVPKGQKGMRAIDLGSGTGVYTEALRRLGYDASGLDSCHGLVAQARTAFPDCYFAESDILVYQPQDSLHVCAMLGDTINHMPSLTSINSLVKNLARHFESGGVWVTTFREYTEQKGEDRFMDICANDDVTIGCFLEREGDFVLNTDLVRAKTDGWRLQKSRYRKLIVTPAMLEEVFHSVGFSVKTSTTPAGLTAVVATKS